METVQKIALVFTIIGAINWGLVGIFDFNLVNALFNLFSNSFKTPLSFFLPHPTKNNTAIIA